MSLSATGKTLAPLLVFLVGSNGIHEDIDSSPCSGGSDVAMNFSESLRKLSRNPSDKQANRERNRLLEDLIKDESEKGDCALAWLAGRRLGDSGEPECEILTRGSRLIEKLEELDALDRQVDLPASSLHSRSSLVEQIRAGRSCDEL